MVVRCLGREARHLLCKQALRGFKSYRQHHFPDRKFTHNNAGYRQEEYHDF